MTPQSWVANVAIVLVTILAIALVYVLAQQPDEIARATTAGR